MADTSTQTDVHLRLAAACPITGHSHVMDGLINAPNLHTITSPALYDQQSLRKLVKSTSLKVIRLVSSHDITDSLERSLIRDPAVQKLVVFDSVSRSVRFDASYILSGLP
jgi:hypothetical protein